MGQNFEKRMGGVERNFDWWVTFLESQALSGGALAHTTEIVNLKIIQCSFAVTCLRKHTCSLSSAFLRDFPRHSSLYCHYILQSPNW